MNITASFFYGILEGKELIEILVIGKNVCVCVYACACV